ncbi:unnamed protein product [Acanthosepion pharaonis]|uniref:Uncharacterized protein n=1 Tax=Acanthosepion pharaonis TaxID=158019 RepID=A0A812BQ21_ACAPH|nr:unnamed protein product [Sepia pharaonis]
MQTQVGSTYTTFSPPKPFSFAFLTDPPSLSPETQLPELTTINTCRTDSCSFFLLTHMPNNNSMKSSLHTYRQIAILTFCLFSLFFPFLLISFTLDFLPSFVFWGFFFCGGPFFLVYFSFSFSFLFFSLFSLSFLFSFCSPFLVCFRTFSR